MGSQETCSVPIPPIHCVHLELLDFHRQVRRLQPMTFEHPASLKLYIQAGSSRLHPTANEGQDLPQETGTSERIPCSPHVSPHQILTEVKEEFVSPVYRQRHRGS